MTNKLNFAINDKLVIDGYNGLSVDLKTNWNEVELAAPLSADATGSVHPYVDGETFIGMLSSKQIKNQEIDIAGVNVIEASYLKGGYYFWARAKGDVVIGDGLTPVAGGFQTTTESAKIKAYAMSGGADGEAIKIRGGNY